MNLKKKNCFVFHLKKRYLFEFREEEVEGGKEE